MEVHTKMTKGHYSPVWQELARLVSSLLFGTRAMLVLNLSDFENKKYTADGRFHGNSPYGGILTKEGPIRTLRFTLPYNNFAYLGKGVYGVLYYAGHGYEDGGENFLLPVDANLKYERQDSLRAQEILETMQACDTMLNLLIIDSCRIR